MRILVCEDHAVTGESLCVLLGQRGHDAAWAANGESALARLSLHPYDALVIDNFLGGIEGIDLLRAVREREALRAVPCVIITAAADAAVREMRAELEELRPAELLRKPFAVEELLAVLEEMTGRPA